MVNGNFTGCAKGMHTPIKVKVEIDNDKITAAHIDLGEGANGYAKVAQNLEEQILKKQSSDLDAVSGASVTSRAVQNATFNALNKAGLEKADYSLKNGTYSASAHGHGGPVSVEVTTNDNKITAVKVTKQTESPYVGDTAMKVIPKEIVKQQTLNVDAITGATMTSEAIINAATKAVAQAGNAQAWSQKPFVKKTTPAKNLTTDVVIAGGGLSGLSTAAFAVKKGLKVVVLEKNDQIGGSFRYAAGAFATHGSKALQKINQDNNMNELLSWIKKANQDDPGSSMNMDFVKYLLHNSGKTFDELLKIAKTDPKFFLKLPYICAGFGAGGQVAQILEKYIESNGGIILRGTIITKINMKNDIATGVQAKNSNGKFTINAKNVVIATGGASYSKEKLLQESMPSLKNVHVFNEANLGNTGDGYDLLQKIGAKIDSNNVYKSAELDFSPMFYTNFSNEPDYSKAIVINDQAKRFTNEAPFSFLNLTTALYREGSSRYYLIYDVDQIDEKFKEKLDKIPQGSKTMVHAQTIEELADKLNLDSTNLKETFNQYQRACALGQDKFGKSSQNLVSFTGKNGYYAIYTMPGSWGTIGGVNINKKMQVQKEDGGYFTNVYAVGEMSTGNLFTDYYMIGFSLSDYSTEGRLLAESL
ncbi:FAD-dependent oxidoreductase [Lactobacillus sp. LL6]|uniref:FAD-dependent oxidoreductase n=1 Tax=Lactobacillus sp. LL6 TaxID=2596827 RepID=UPI0011859FC8|nr:FAD-dependent oxidoreductase [Lactobacillus sp. LL6]TSO26315.1 FAD-dependent oxidoreductase [Lactobacillus sp. LL6]